MKTFKPALLTVALASALALAAPAQALEHLDAFYYNQNDNFISQISAELKAQAREAGVTLHEFNAMDDLLVQNESIATAAAKGKQPMAINPVDTGGAQGVADIVQKNGNPVIFFNRVPAAEVLASLDKAYYVGSESERSGTLQGELLASWLAKNPQADRNGDGVIALALIKGQSNHQDTAIRTSAALQALQQSGIKTRVVFSQSGNWSYSSGHALMNAALTAQGATPIEAVLCNNDALALGAAAALQEQGFNLPQGSADKFIALLGIDGIAEARQAVQDGVMLGTVVQDAQTQGKIIFTLAQLLADGKEIPLEIAGVKQQDKSFYVPFKAVVRESK